MRATLMAGMNYFIFQTEGSWETTTLFLNGEEFLASRLFIQCETGRDWDGDPVKGGLRNGGQMTAYVQPQDGGVDYALFPGKIDLEFPTRKVTIENQSANFAIEFTRVYLDGQEISDELLDIQIDIDAINNNVTASLTVFRPRLFGADEVATYSLI